MQHKRRRILRALARQGGLASPGELYGGLGLAPRTGSRVLGRLRAEGAVSGTKRRVCLTEAGWAAVERGQARPRRSSVARAPRPRRPPPTRRASVPNVAPPADFEQEEASGVSGLGLLEQRERASETGTEQWRRPAGRPGTAERRASVDRRAAGRLGGA
jgi:hypothetical protein